LQETITILKVLANHAPVEQITVYLVVLLDFLAQVALSS